MRQKAPHQRGSRSGRDEAPQESDIQSGFGLGIRLLPAFLCKEQRLQRALHHE